MPSGQSEQTFLVHVIRSDSEGKEKDEDGHR